MLDSRSVLAAVVLLLGACASEPPRHAGRPQGVQPRPGPPEPRRQLVLGFMKPGERIPIPKQPPWRERACEYPEGWNGPAAGGVALFSTATRDELIASHPDYHPATDAAKPAPNLAAAQQRHAFDASARLAQVHIDGIDGSELEHLPWIPISNSVGAPLTSVLVPPEGGEVSDIREVDAETVSKLAETEDWVALGRAWAARLQSDAAARTGTVPTLERQAELKPAVAKALGERAAEAVARDMARGAPPPDPRWYREDAWIAVACDLVQLARYARSTHRRLYVQMYVD